MMTYPYPPISVEQGLLGAITRRQSRCFDHIPHPQVRVATPASSTTSSIMEQTSTTTLRAGNKRVRVGVPYRSPHAGPSRGTRRVMEGAKECLDSEDGD